MHRKGSRRLHGSSCLSQASSRSWTSRRPLVPCRSSRHPLSAAYSGQMLLKSSQSNQAGFYFSPSPPSVYTRALAVGKPAGIHHQAGMLYTAVHRRILLPVHVQRYSKKPTEINKTHIHEYHKEFSCVKNEFCARTKVPLTDCMLLKTLSFTPLYIIFLLSRDPYCLVSVPGYELVQV